MTCKCGSSRIMYIGGKTSDMCSANVEHLKLDYDGYVPSRIGIGGGDYIDFEFCLDCGQIQNWKPVTDHEVKVAFNNGEEPDEEDDEDEPVIVPTLDEVMASSSPPPLEVRYTHNGYESQLHWSNIMYQRNQAELLLIEAFGKGWRGNREALDILRNSVQGPPSVIIGAAAYMLLKEVE